MRRLIIDAAIYGVGDLIFKFVTFAVFPIYANLFSVEQFGVLALVITSAALVGVVLNLGLNNAIQRYYFEPNMLEERRPVLVSTGLIILLLWSSLVTLLLLFGLHPLKGTLEQRYDIEWLFLVLALTSNIPLLIVTYCLDVLRLHFSPWWYSLLAALRSLPAVAIGLFLIVALEQGLLGIFAGQVLGLILAVPLGLWLIRKELRWRFDFGVAREIVLFGYPFVFVSLAYWAFGSMDRWMLGELSDNTNVGLFSIAYSFAGVITFVTLAFGQAWSPYVFKLYAEDPDYRDKIGRLFSYWFFALAFIGLIISLFGYEILRLTTPETYWPAATTLSVLAMGFVLAGTTQFTPLGISLERRTNLLSVAAWITAIVNFFLNLVLIPKWGALGSGAATFVSYAALTGLYLYWAQKLHPLPLEAKKLSFSLLIVVSAPLFSGFLNSFAWSVWLIAVKALILGLVLLLGFAARIIKFSDIKRVADPRVVRLAVRERG
jgi:O-antigen/teichoic acid export membrane protein